MRFTLAFILLATTTFAYSQQPKLMLPVGHTSFMLYAGFSPDGSKIITTSWDNTAKLWHAETGALLADLPHSGFVNSASFSNDGKSFTTNANGSIQLWSTYNASLLGTPKGTMNAWFSPDGKQLITENYSETYLKWKLPDLKDPDTVRIPIQGKVQSANALSADTKTIVAALYDSTLKILDVQSGRVLWQQNTSSEITSIKISPVQDNFITVSKDSTAQLWNINTGSLLKTFHHNDVQAASYSPDGKRLITVGDEVARIWEVSTGKILFLLKGHTNHIMDGNFSEDGKYIVTGAADDTARVWNAATGSLVHILAAHTGTIQMAKFSPDSKKILTASNDGTAKLWRVETGKLLVDLTGHTYQATGAKFAPGGNFFVSSSSAYELKIWDVKNSRLFANLENQFLFRSKPVFSPSGKFMVTQFRDDTSQTITTWNTTTWNWDLKLQVDTTAMAVIFSPGDKYMVAATEDSVVRMVDVTDGNILYYIDSTAICGVQGIFNPSEDKFISVESSVAVVRSAGTGEVLFVLDKHRNTITSTVFTPDGQKIITTARDGKAMVWDAGTGKLLLTFDKHKAPVISACISPDGKKVMTVAPHTFANDGNSVKVWDIETGNLFFEIKGGYKGVFRPAFFSKDGKTILTISGEPMGSLEDIARIWDAETGKFIDTLASDPSYRFTDVDFEEGKFLAVTNSDFGLFDLHTKQRSLRIVAIDSTDYIALLPDRYYQSTPVASRLLHYVTPDLNVISFDQLDVKFNRPDLVLAAAGNKDSALINSYYKAYLKRMKKLEMDTVAFNQSSLPEADFSNRRQIAFEQKSKQLHIHIKGGDSLSLLNRFNVWINDIPLFGMKGISLKDRHTNFLDTSFTIELSYGKNVIETSVTNVNGIESYRSPLIVDCEEKPSSTERVYFIGFGINRFAQKGHDLQWSVKDVRDLADSLKKKHGNAIEIITLFDEKVTVKNILALKQKLMQTRINDKVIISYSGHGVLSSNYDYYLSTYNIDFKDPEAHGLPYDLLESLIDGIPARKKLMLIDACYSGEVDKEEMRNYTVAKTADKGAKGLEVNNAAPPSAAASRNTFELMQEIFVNVSRSTGATIICAASGTQVAREGGKYENGFFTYAILELMKKKGITVNTLKSYVNRRVPELSNNLQKPTNRSETKALDWEVW